MINIDKVYRIVNSLGNIYNERAKIGPDTFNVYANDVQWELFYEEKSKFEESGVITEALRPFNSNPYILRFDGEGKATYPDRFEKTTALYKKIVLSNDATLPDTQRFKTVDITEIDKNNLSDRLSSTIPGISPTYESPIYVVHAEYFQIYPQISCIATLEYLLLPIDVVWAFTEVDRQPVYDPANSVDFQWPGSMINELAKRILKLYGIEIRDTELLNATQGI